MEIDRKIRENQKNQELKNKKSKIEKDGKI